jgi:hypothetical protein
MSLTILGTGTLEVYERCDRKSEKSSDRPWQLSIGFPKLSDKS